MKILVGSDNPVKIEAVREAFSHYYEEVEIVSFEVESGVPDQPVNDDTYKGAENRANELVVINERKNLNADFFVGVEGGILQVYQRWFGFGCMCIINKDGNKSFGTSAHFELPNNVTERLLQGEELGNVMDEVQNKQNTKQKQGAIGYFTAGVMNRKELYVPGLISALVPFNHPVDYFS
jgi:inosine/xanthosine triphosphatase